MVYKTLIKKTTKEFCTYSGGYMYTSDIPTILSNDATMDILISLATNYDSVVPGEINWNEYEIVELDINFKK